jgi:hypothetical protein
LRDSAPGYKFKPDFLRSLHRKIAWRVRSCDYEAATRNAATLAKTGETFAALGSHRAAEAAH